MYLLECVCFAMTCAFRWGVTHVGYYHTGLHILSSDYYFRYRECTGGRRPLEATFRRKSGCGFGRDFCITCIRNCTF